MSLFLLFMQLDAVSFNVWDIGGPASMSTVNQCFFTDKALYMVIWNLALGEEAVANLQSWLLNIEVRKQYVTDIRKTESFWTTPLVRGSPFYLFYFSRKVPLRLK